MTKLSLQDRIRIIELAESKMTDAQIADQVKCSIPTVRKWRRRGQRQGRQGLASTLGRPASGALGSYSSEIRATVQAWRTDHPGWGPKTLLAELVLDERFKGQMLPGCSSIARWLEEEGLTRRYEKHQDLPQPAPSPAQFCHEEWEMDAKGHQYIPDVGMVALINVNDILSKVKVMSYPCWLGQQQAQHQTDTPDYQLVLRLAFREWGLPDRLAVDHGSVFYDNNTKSPFPTRFHLWLLALGIDLTFGRKGRPTDQGTTERSHQLWEKQVLLGQRFTNWTALYTAVRDRRTFLNEHLPCATVGDIPPLVAYPEARVPRRPYRPEWETDMLDLSHVYAYLSRGRWFRRTSQVGTFKLGGEVYYLSYKRHNQDIELTFNPASHDLVVRASDGDVIKKLPIKGLAPADLMGDMDPLFHLINFQLALPFSKEDWRVIRLCENLGDTS